MKTFAPGVMSRKNERSERINHGVRFVFHKAQGLESTKKIKHNFHSHTSSKLPTNKGASSSSSHGVCWHSPSFTDHSWLKECSGKRGTRDRRSEALIQTRLCAVLLCSPHQEWDSLWWISTKRFGTYKERQFSQVSYFKPGNLGIRLAHRGTLGSLQVLSGKLRPDG